MTDLLSATSQLVAIRSVSRDEGALSRHLESALRSGTNLRIERIGDNLVASSTAGRPARVVLAGHLDTVPPFGSEGPRVEGDTLWGLGSVDMKGGLAVMLDLAPLVENAGVDVTLVFYVCEEIEHDANGLAWLARNRPEVLEADAAVLLEPTGGLVEAGCQGTMRLSLSLTGRRAHTARPHMGLNALHRMGKVLVSVGSYEPRTVVLDGCTYTEQLQAVAASGGVAHNVVPDSATLTLNHRFAPDRDASTAMAHLKEFLDEVVDESLGDRIELVDVAEGAPPALDNELLAGLVDASGERPRAKIGWTDVATFHALGVPAANFGPGDPLLAHTPDEHVCAADLDRARRVLRDFISSSG